MKQFRKVWAIILSVIMLVSLAGCGSSSTGSKEAGAKVIKLGHCHPPDSQFHLGSVKFAELVAQKTNGKVKIEVFHSSQLGDEPELAEGVRVGTMDMALLATGNVAKFEPKFNIFDLPYLIRDNAHADKVLDGEVGAYLASELDKKGVKILGYWESGFRHYVNNKVAIKSPEDLNGLKMRVPNWPVLMATTKAMGASVIPMGFSEIYLAAQQGVIDGQEGPIFAIKSGKMYEVQKYMVLDGHTYAPMVLTINPKLYSGLSSDQQKALVEAAKEAGIYERKILREKEAEELKFLETTGKMTVEKNPDKLKWREATKGIYDQFGDKFGKDLIQKIVDTK